MAELSTANTANTAIYDANVHRAAMLRLYEESVHKKVSVVMDGHEMHVTDYIEKNLGRSMDKAFQEKLDQKLLASYTQAHNVSSASFLSLCADQTSFIYQNIESAVGKFLRVERPEQRIAADIVLKRPLAGDDTLSEGWARVSNAEKVRLEGVIRKGIAEGKPPSEIALELRKGNVFNISRGQSRGLVTTAMTSVVAQTDHEVYVANTKILDGWQYVALLDSRTSKLCAYRNGTIYPVGDVQHLPPAHFHCRSHTIPIVKSYAALGKSDALAAIRKRNFDEFTDKEIAYFDGQSPLKETYSDWLSRQPTKVQLQHLGDTQKLALFQQGKLDAKSFINADGKSIGIKELRAASNDAITVPGDTVKFANAKERLDAIRLGATRPDEFIGNKELTNNLREYYLLQTKDLDGQLSYTNYRGNLLHSKKATRNRVLNSPPKEEQMKFNPVTGRYEDTRLFQPSPAVLDNNLRLVAESEKLHDADKAFITDFVNSLEDEMSVNERAVISDNLRITFGRFRENQEPWDNFKAVLNGQIKFDIMNVSDFMETQLRKDSNLLHRLKMDNYIDPVLGPSQLDDLHDNFLKNVKAKNRWEDRVAPKIASELQGIVDLKIPFGIRRRIADKDIDDFYLKFAKLLSLADSPDRDQLAVILGRSLYNKANYRGTRKQWYDLGLTMLDSANDKGFYKLETFGVQKRRMKSRNGGHLFGPYYDTFAVNLRITDPRIHEYSTLSRKVDVGLRTGDLTGKNRLLVKEGYKTYFADEGVLGQYDTRLPITSSSSFSDFPTDLVDANMVKALNWTSQTKYKIDGEYFDFIDKLLMFQDDKGKAAYYDALGEYKHFICERGDAYERFKAMKWLRQKDAAFSNHPFLDHRARVYERGFIGPQSGETFRPFLNSLVPQPLKSEGFYNFQDQVGAFLGGHSDKLEGNFNSLAILGRQKIAEKWRKDLVDIGNAMRRAKPNDIRFVLEHPMAMLVDGEEQGKFFRFALEMSKIDEFLAGNYSKKSLERLAEYNIAIALEQDASSSGAQIIALTTRNKKLAEMSNVVPTNQKRRLYDEIAYATYHDPRFIELNKKLGLSEKDLRKANS